MTLPPFLGFCWLSPSVSGKLSVSSKLCWGTCSEESEGDLERDVATWTFLIILVNFPLLEFFAFSSSKLSVSSGLSVKFIHKTVRIKFSASHVSYVFANTNVGLTMLQKLSKCEVKAWLLKFDDFTTTLILREIKFWWILTVQKCHFWQFQRLWILVNLVLEVESCSN